MRLYTEEDRELVVTLAYDHGGLSLVDYVLYLLTEPTFELFIDDSNTGYIGHYKYSDDVVVLFAVKDDNKFTKSMWYYLRDIWCDPKTTSIINIQDNHSILETAMVKRNKGYRISSLLINPKEQ